MSNISFKKEIQRKLIHFSSIIHPIIYFCYSKNTALLVMTILMTLVSLFEILRIKDIKIPFLKPVYGVLRTSETKQKKFTGAFYFLLAAIVITILFPKDIAIMAMLVIIISDTAAALIGRKYGRINIGNGKSLEGSLSFFISAFLSCYLYFIVAQFHYSIALIALSCLLSTLVEAYSSKLKLNDNFIVPVAFSLFLFITTYHI